MDIMGTLKSKIGGIPVWIIALILTAAVAWYMRTHKSKTPTSTAAGQTNSTTGTASQLSDMFPTAGMMPFQGGDVYVNTTGAPSSQTPAGTKMANIAAGQTIDQVVQGIRGSGNPNFSWADFLALNPGITSSANVEYVPGSPARAAVGLGPDYKFTKDTSVVVSNASLQSFAAPPGYPVPKG